MHAFPGGTSVTALRVYDTPSIDGLAGGTPHFHTASTESYIVVDGVGALQTIGPEGFRETPLEAGVVVWFTPGTIHRAINSGGLRVICVMQNAGLPEAGDAIMTFPDEIVGDPEKYADAATLPAGTGVAAGRAAAARRDLAVTGFLALRDAIRGGDTTALERLYAHAARIARPRIEGWRATLAQNVRGEVEHTESTLDSLANGSSAPLLDAALFEAEANSGDERYGMCGRLRTYDVTPRAKDRSRAAT